MTKEDVYNVLLKGGSIHYGSFIWDKNYCYHHDDWCFLEEFDTIEQTMEDIGKYTSEDWRYVKVI